MISLKLYVSSRSKISRRAAENVKAFLDSRFPDRYILDVIDVLEYPERALAENILATPTLIKSEPKPPKKIIGDLSAQKDLEELLEIKL